ncbi:MAG: ribokinase [Cryobacterium sp.]|nr:ribokinase [Cryobacterium sp.]MBX3103512.1 ribokinase [Cryobacterium sp.]
MTEHSGVVVLGSLNMDIVLSVERIPGPGETLLAREMDTYPGGKGLNQAVAVARANAPCTMIGFLGTDDFGRSLRDVLETERIENSRVLEIKGQTTGQAFITVSQSAENSIVVVSGANINPSSLTERDLESIASARVLLAQLEIPISRVSQAARFAKSKGSTVVLNAAPATELDDDLLSNLDFLIVNEHEASIIAKENDLPKAMQKLAGKVDNLIVTLGKLGSVVFSNAIELFRTPAFEVKAVDTTGAGDTFCGAFVAAISKGETIQFAVRYATAASALAVTKQGAVPSIPTEAEVEEFLAARL